MRPLEKISVRQVDEAAVARICAELSVNRPLGRILVGRGLTSFDTCKAFFRPALTHLHDPFLFPGMERAVERICKAIACKEYIAIYGDYDVDGVTSTAFLMKVLVSLGAACRYYLPNRISEGYGLSEKGIAELADDGVDVIVTVDCGISACREIEKAKSLGIDVIVTDHHEPKADLPPADALIDPKIENCGYPDRDLAGVGVALKLAQALCLRLGKPDEIWQEHLDLAALGTAADIVPLTGENRIITRFGFEKMSTSPNLGLRALISLRGLSGKRLSTSQVVFMLAPCINAVGRLGDPYRGVELLLTEDPAVAGNHARELLTANNERKTLDQRVQEEAFGWIDENCDMERCFGIVAGHESWHCGVIGIVASKITERYHRPAILFSVGENGLAKGSGRSIPGFHLLEALEKCGEHLESFGGHAAAAGMVIRKENMETFREAFNEAAKSAITPELLTPTVLADTETCLDDFDTKFVNILKQMEPFGPGNMRPVLLCHGLSSKYAPRVVGKNHLKLAVTDGKTMMNAIGFNQGHRLRAIADSNHYSLAFTLDENEWNGRVSLQMKLKGLAL